VHQRAKKRFPEALKRAAERRQSKTKTQSIKISHSIKVNESVTQRQVNCTVGSLEGAISLRRQVRDMDVWILRIKRGRNHLEFSTNCWTFRGSQWRGNSYPWSSPHWIVPLGIPGTGSGWQQFIVSYTISTHCIHEDTPMGPVAGRLRFRCDRNWLLQWQTSNLVRLLSYIRTIARPSIG